MVFESVWFILKEKKNFWLFFVMFIFSYVVKYEMDIV